MRSFNFDLTSGRSTANCPGEASVWVLGLNLEAEKSLAQHYEQHAFV